ncbi:nucleotidyltransferase domain-containing protein [Oceanobacillus sp. Castelsardo]|uniref:nucleotidyltransferase domain-containing protein n=1 Tax=Oceanobacillus sp. Castelsardo TaxID=1851204 RepID=UPI00083812E3|nr:nucleotidyltransferase domain-containing protein [Oceanobacillus sp. Castelsardo]
MKDIIVAKIKEIEKEKNIKVLYACEAGSRAWGVHSIDSDYDVRFIYVHPTDYYLSIDPIGIGKKRDTIDFPIHSSLDLHGWELTKALKLYRKSNPGLLEWLHSPIIYFESPSIMKRLIDLEAEVFQPMPCVHHYIHMAKNNLRKIDESPEINIKLYFQVVRPILMAKWIIIYSTFPSIHFTSLVHQLSLPENAVIEVLIKIKTKQLSESNLPVGELQSFITNEIDFLEQSVPQLKTKQIRVTKKLDSLFRVTLKEIWRN